MQKHIGYIRVSTVKQGTHGVSLTEQKDAISRYAAQHGLTIDLWLEETETAAKRGRSVFSHAVKLLRERRYCGMILHKLDRGARNLKDWAEIAELSDIGVEIHFAHESLDLHSRGGRLSADIQAVVASDYIRNLREETRKGFYGRLKQGLYPLQAPIGYRNHGTGLPKTIDPLTGPLVRKAFESYATGRYTFETLRPEMHGLGLRNRRGGPVSLNGFSTMLNNPFYIGIIRIDKTNETFLGIHERLIAKTLFERVQKVINTKINTCVQRHAFEFRRLLSCGGCGYALIGERQKGRVYYRCHIRECPTTSIREDDVHSAVKNLLARFLFNDEEVDVFRAKLAHLRKEWTHGRDEELRSMNLQLGQVNDRLNRLTDAYLDKALDKEMFEERKKKILFERATLEENINRLNVQDSRAHERVREFLELLGNASESHEKATPEERREMVGVLTSNRTISGKNAVVEPSIPFREIAKRFENESGDPYRGIPRTWNRIIEHLLKLNTLGQLPNLSAIPGFQKKDIKEEISLEE